MYEAGLGMINQGGMRNRLLSITREKFFSRSCGVHPIILSRGATFHAAVLKPRIATSEFPFGSPADWTIPTEALPCKCSRCAELRGFCADTEADVHRFVVRRDLRSHIGREFAASGIDMRFETERGPSRQAGLCKDPWDLSAAPPAIRRKYRRDARLLIGIAKDRSSSPGLAERLRAAVGRSG